MLYVSQINEMLSQISGFCRLLPGDVAKAEAEIKTPLAIGTAITYPNAIYKDALAMATKAGWLVVRWGWTTHGAYKVLLLAKRFAHEPLKVRGAAGYLELGCSCNLPGAVGALAYKLPPADYDKPYAATLAVYNGEPLTAAQWAKARAGGWHRILRSNVLAWGLKPSQLSDAEQREFFIGKYRVKEK